MTEAQHMVLLAIQSTRLKTGCLLDCIWRKYLPIEQCGTGNPAAELSRNVHCRSQRRYQSREEAGNGDGRIYVCAWKTIGNVNYFMMPAKGAKSERENFQS